jgi:tetratricopeptide (TPR) repeat protein
MAQSNSTKRLGVLEAATVKIIGPEDVVLGAGLLVSSKGLLVTCAHVLRAAGVSPGGRVQLEFYADQSRHFATADKKLRRSENAEDIAFLRLDPLQLPLSAKPAPLGTSSQCAENRFQTLGFPAVGTRAAMGLDHSGLWGEGRIGLPLSRQGRSLLQIHDELCMAPGFSGGAILDTQHQRVIGLNTSILAPGANGQLQHVAFIIPAEALKAVCPDLELIEFQPDELLDPKTRGVVLEHSPSALLVAEHEVVPFYEPGRAELLRQFINWCDHPEHTAVRMLHAPGGYGKTRFGIQLSSLLRGLGWRAGFLPPSRTTDELKESVRQNPQDILAIIDYAESRSHLGDVLSFLAKRGNGGPKVRVLLLARNDGAWWGQLQNAFDTRLRALLSPQYNEPVAYPVAPLVPNGEPRQEVYAQAVEALRKRLKRPLPTTRPKLDDQLFSRVLYLHMAALAAVLDISFSTANDLTERILDHEQHAWETRGLIYGLTDDELPVWVAQLQQVLASAVLVGGQQEANREALLRRLFPEEPLAQRKRFHNLLRDLYPPTGLLAPDLLGEAMTLRALSLEDNAPAFLERVFSDESSETLQRGFWVLGSLSVDHPKAVRPWLDSLLSNQLEQRALPAFRAAKQLGARHAFAELGPRLHNALAKYGTPALAEALSQEGFPAQSVSLREVAVWSYTHLVAMHRKLSEEEEALPNLARSLNNLGLSYSQMGRKEEALHATEESVAIRRKLAAKDEAALLPALANSLNSLGLSYSQMGRREEALRSVEEAVALYRKLPEKNPETFLPDLAFSLNSLGIHYRNIGKKEEALCAAEEAHAKYHQLSEKNKEAFLPELAMSLNNLGLSYSQVDRKEEALRSTEEATLTWRELAAKNADSFLPDLAMSLNSLGNRYSQMGRKEEALRSTEEAVTLYRKLSEKNQEAFAPDLARSLNNLGAFYSEAGRKKEALRATEESVTLYRKLSEKNQEAFSPDLARSLNNLGASYRETGRAREAGEVWLESLRKHWPYLLKYPARFLEDVRRTLQNLLELYQEQPASIPEELESWRKELAQLLANPTPKDSDP